MATLLTPEQIQEKLKNSKDWENVAGKEILRKYAFKDFSEALRFVNRVGELAEGMDHHPDIFLHKYKLVTLTLTTHSAGGLTRMDFDLAERVDKAFLDVTKAVF